MKLIAVGGIAVFLLLGLVGAAQALEFQTKSGKSLAGETFSAYGEEEAVLEGLGATVFCASFSMAGKLAASATAKEITVTYKGCGMPGKTCTVPSEISTNSLKATTEAGVGVTYTHLSPEGKSFVELKFGGTECSLAGLGQVSGALCAVGAAKGVFAVEQELKTPAGGGCASSLKIAGANAATLKQEGMARLSGVFIGVTWGVA